jgi:hypothetical protein
MSTLAQAAMEAGTPSRTQGQPTTPGANRGFRPPVGVVAAEPGGEAATPVGVHVGQPSTSGAEHGIEAGNLEARTQVGGGHGTGLAVHTSSGGDDDEVGGMILERFNMKSNTGYNVKGFSGHTSSYC